ncbi:MAG: substrate-binding domain-containing protein [Deltaproteobacteria bacterium]|nr:substrate-binding domain-containing protein [Deltaproteobacteria bacterium]MBW2479203.1 substrate-binding domain-containing protein [Deltaproteobacteria bacterium]
MNRFCRVGLMVVLVLGLIGYNAWAGDKILKMSTTTSTQASGLLDVLLPELDKDTGIQVKVIAKGTGAAIRDGMDGNVDVIFVHARAREEKFVEDGYGTKRYAVMHNDFVILGPAKDPAGIRGIKSAAEALLKIASAKSPFISRGDDSGTHTKEQALWKATGLSLEKKTSTIVKKGKKSEVTFLHPAGLGQWYLSIGQGMGKALTFADEKQAYIMADRGTYIKYKFGRDVPIDLVVLCEGDPLLANPYGVIPINPQKHPHVKYDLAKEFAEWLVSERGQSVIDGYRLLGQQLFYPDAIK